MPSVSPSSPLPDALLRAARAGIPPPGGWHAYWCRVMEQAPSGPDGNSWWAFALNTRYDAAVSPETWDGFWSAASSVLPWDEAPVPLHTALVEALASHAFARVAAERSDTSPVCDPLCACLARALKVWGQSPGLLTQMLDRQTPDDHLDSLRLVATVLAGGASWDERSDPSAPTCLQKALLAQKTLPAAPFSENIPQVVATPDGRTLLHCLFDGYTPSALDALGWVRMLANLRHVLASDQADWSVSDATGRTPWQAWHQAHARHPFSGPFAERNRADAGVMRDPQTHRLGAGWVDKAMAAAEEGHLRASLPSSSPARAKVRL